MSNPVGRPTSYNAEITEKIIDLVIDGQPIRFICSQVDIYRDWETDRKSTRLNSSHSGESRMPSSA